MARAATSGRSLAFFSVGTVMPLEGYLVGSDDFHWLVVHSEEDGYPVSLVHKGSTTRITISPKPTLYAEPTEYQDRVRQIGTGFWEYCDKTYNPKPATTKSTLETA